MPVNESYLKALKNPVVTWNTPFEDEVKVINPEISMARFTVEFDNVGTRSLRAYVYTPRLQAYSVGSEDDASNLRDLQFVTELMTSQDVMEKYLNGVPKTAGYCKERFSGWKTKGAPFGGFMCYSGDEQVGIFNLGEGDDPGVGEFAAISAVKHWKKGFASEVGLLLYKYPNMVRSAGYKLSDGSELNSVTATARPDNGSAFVMERLGLTCVRTEVKYDKDRKIFQNSIDELNAVMDNTRFRNSLGL